MRNKYTHQQLHQQEEHEEEQHYKQQRSTKFLPMLCSLSTKQVIKLSASNSQRHSSSTSSTTSPSVSDDPLSPKVGCMGQVKRNNKVVGFPPRSCTRETSNCSNNIAIKCHEQIISNYSTNNGAIVKYHMIKRLFFSSKSLTSSPTTTTAATSTAVAVARSRAHKGGIKSAGRNNTSNNNHSNNNGGIRGSCTGVIRDNHDHRHHHHHGVIPRSKIDENCNNGDIIGFNSKKKDENEKGSFVNLMDLDPPLPVVKQKQQQQQEEENLSLWKRRSKGVPLKSLQVQVAQQQPPPCNNLPLQATTV